MKRCSSQYQRSFSKVEEKELPHRTTTTFLFRTSHKFVEQSGRRDSYSTVTKQFQEPSDQTTETYEDRSRVGQVICLWTYEAEPASPGKASFGELSVSYLHKVTGAVHSCSPEAHELKQLVFF